MFREYDALIIGGGPAGLSAAVNLSSEEVDTALLDCEEILGGQAGTSSLIENYAGHACGVTGEKLAADMTLQARRFGTDVFAPVRASRIARDSRANKLIVCDDAGDEFIASAVVLATGVRYRRLPLLNVADYLKRGVSYGSPSLDSVYDSQELFVIGGANSAGQAAVHLARCPGCTVHVVVRGESLDLKMSHYLIEKIRKASNIVVHTKSEVVAVGGDSRLTELTLRSPEGEKTMPASEMFVMIGAVPHTTWLDGTVERDRGYIPTGRDLCEKARAMFEEACGRQPFNFETSMRGVFAIGDVQAGAVRRVAAAAGAGSMLAPDIHRYLATL